MKYLILLLVLSCSSVQGGDWSEWSRCGVEQREMRWDFCKEQLHGDKYAKRGFCYPADECRTRRTMWPFRNVKTQTRVKMFFCRFPTGPDDHEAWECINKYNIDNKVLMTEP